MDVMRHRHHVSTLNIARSTVVSVYGLTEPITWLQSLGLTLHKLVETRLLQSKNVFIDTGGMCAWEVQDQQSRLYKEH